jgi:formate dehydrogenase subunit gamma
MSAASAHWPAWHEASALELLAPLLSLPGPLLPALHAVQAHFGFIPPEATALLATTFNLSRAEVHGVITFYDFFRREPPGQRIVRLRRRRGRGR